MSFNRKLLKQMTEESKQKKPQPKPKDRIVDPMGQWNHPGEITRIPSNRITMQGVPYPVKGIGSTGQEQMMYPGQEYSFPGSDYVDEFPLIQARNGGEEPTPLDLAKIKARMALESHFGNPSARRMTTPYPQDLAFKLDRGKDKGKMGYGTHWMGDMGNYAVPFIQEDASGKLFFKKNASPRDREAMRFNTPEEALMFAENYKEVAPMSRNNFRNGGQSYLPKAQKGLTKQDSVKHQAGKILSYEQLRGGPGGAPLPQYSDPKYMNMLMNNIYPEVKKILPNASAMEAGEAMDFIFNAGWDKDNKKITKDPRAFALQEYYRKNDPSKLDKEGKWSGRKNPAYSFDQEYSSTIGKLPENERRILMNKGRDWYYKNINNPAPGVPNSNYYDTWYGRIWNTNDFNDFNPNNPKFIPQRKNGGDISIPNLEEGSWLNRYDEGGSLPKFQMRGEVPAYARGPIRGDIQMRGNVNIPTQMAYDASQARKAQAAREATTIGADTRTAAQKAKDAQYAAEINKRRKDLGFIEGTGHTQQAIERDRAKADRIIHNLVDVPATVIGAGELAYGVGKGVGKVASQAGEYLTTQTPLKNAYKLNPWAFKPKEGMVYRGIGEKGMKDALESGVFRSPRGLDKTYWVNPNEFQYAKNHSKTIGDDLQIGKSIIAEYPKDKAVFYPEFKGQFEDALYSTDVLPINQGRILKKDWLRGYKEVPKPKTVEDLVDLYRVQEKGFDINSNTIAQMEKAAAEGRLSSVQKMMLNNPYDRKRLMARDKFWGQWFEKDPKRLEYYIKDKGPESEILNVKIPRSQAPNYSIKNFESQEPVQGAPLEYYQRMSLSPETEFILPKDIIKGAKKYPLSEWERLIKEHKPWMGLLPLAGAIEQKKKGGQTNWLDKYN